MRSENHDSDSGGSADMVVKRAPRAMAWVVLLASTGAVLIVGLVTTLAILGGNTGRVEPVGFEFGARFVLAGVMTAMSLALRSLRWIFLLRRAETRVPIRDAYIGYFAGFALLLAPFALGEIAVRATVLRRRGRVPIATTIVTNLWERLFDLVALAAIAGALGVLSAELIPGSWMLLLIALLPMRMTVRRFLLDLASSVAVMTARVFDQQSDRPLEVGRFVRPQVCAVAFATSVVAWLLPGVGFWVLANSLGHEFGLLAAQRTFASSTVLGGMAFAPGGIFLVGSLYLLAFDAAGFPKPDAMLIVIAVRMATMGLASVFGILFLILHLRSRPEDESHFDAIADAYDVQIAEHRRRAMLLRKTELMREYLEPLGSSLRGLDVGCGQGAYVVRMRELGYEVTGVDPSVGQVAIARRKIGSDELVRSGSVLEIPAPDASCDFAFAINVLHHLGSVDEQCRAFRELFRILRPGGLLFVHEINTKNILFRFYMSYVFPSLNCVDEGVEWWMLPDDLTRYTDVPVRDVRYFTFLPEFAPAWLVRALSPIERRLEGSRFREYSAHYMAIWSKPDPGSASSTTPA